MRILIVNAPYHAITTRYGVGAQVPLGLLLIAGAIVSEGHEVRLLDGEARYLRSRKSSKPLMLFPPL